MFNLHNMSIINQNPVLDLEANLSSAHSLAESHPDLKSYLIPKVENKGLFLYTLASESKLHFSSPKKCLLSRGVLHKKVTDISPLQ